MKRIFPSTDREKREIDYLGQKRRGCTETFVGLNGEEILD